ncbi:hypothetical protein FOZ62_027275, partial [Perkinsus olseni]
YWWCSLAYLNIGRMALHNAGFLLASVLILIWSILLVTTTSATPRRQTNIPLFILSGLLLVKDALLLEGRPQSDEQGIGVWCRSKGVIQKVLMLLQTITLTAQLDSPSPSRGSAALWLLSLTPFMGLLILNVVEASVTVHSLWTNPGGDAAGLTAELSPSQKKRILRCGSSIVANVLLAAVAVSAVLEMTERVDKSYIEVPRQARVTAVLAALSLLISFPVFCLSGAEWLYLRISGYYAAAQGLDVEEILWKGRTGEVGGSCSDSC